RERFETCGCYPDIVGMQVLRQRRMRLWRRVLPVEPFLSGRTRSLSRSSSGKSCLWSDASRVVEEYKSQT
ncbi:MAG: hypothetical protein AABZ61_06700, partial [Bacteroidota bacterium]